MIIMSGFGVHYSFMHVITNNYALYEYEAAEFRRTVVKSSQRKRIFPKILEKSDIYRISGK